jgi:hypothetical protein
LSLGEVPRIPGADKAVAATAPLAADIIYCVTATLIDLTVGDTRDT